MKTQIVRFSRNSLFAAAIFLTIGSISAAPILFYDFNTTGANQTSTGSSALTLQTVVGTTPTNKVTNTPPTLNGSSFLGFAGTESNTVLQGAVSSYPELTTDLASFTITAWVQNLTSGLDSRLFYLTNDAHTPVGIIDFKLSSSTTGPSRLHLNINNAGDRNSGPGLTVPVGSEIWQFVAVTYNHTNGNIVFYSAPFNEMLESATPAAAAFPPNTNAANLYIGNSHNQVRLLNANIDNIGFYNTALSASEIEAVFASVIPEPGTPVLLGIAAALFFIIRRKLRVI